MKPEAKIVDAIRGYLLERRQAGIPCWWFKTHGSVFQRAGIPDLILCWRGRFVAIEVKQPGKSPTRLQEHVMRTIRLAGGMAFVARSVEDVEQQFE